MSPQGTQMGEGIHPWQMLAFKKKLFACLAWHKVKVTKQIFQRQ
jgi:hypothetical protein